MAGSVISAKAGIQVFSARIVRRIQRGLRPQPNLSLAKHAKAAKKSRARTSFDLGDLRAFARNTVPFTWAPYAILAKKFARAEKI